MENKDEGNSSKSKSGSSFVRIRSLNALGEVVLRTYSRPLKKGLSPDIVISFAMIQELNEKVKQTSDENLVKHRRIGCTPDEVYELYSAFFSEKAKSAVKSTLEDIARRQIDPSKEIVTVAEAQKILSKARESVLSYADDVTKLSKDKIKSDLKRQILRIVGDDKEDVVDSQVDRMVTNTLGALTRNLLTKDQNVASPKEQSGADDDILFPDW